MNLTIHSGSINTAAMVPVMTSQTVVNMSVNTGGTAAISNTIPSTENVGSWGGRWWKPYYNYFKRSSSNTEVILSSYLGFGVLCSLGRIPLYATGAIIAVGAGLLNRLKLSDSYRPTCDEGMAMRLRDKVDGDRRYRESVELLEGCLKEEPEFMRYLGCDDPDGFSVLDSIGDTWIVETPCMPNDYGRFSSIAGVVFLGLEPQKKAIVHEGTHVLDLLMPLVKRVPIDYVQYVRDLGVKMISKYPESPYLKRAVSVLDEHLMDEDEGVETPRRVKQAIGYIPQYDVKLRSKIEAIGSHFDTHKKIRAVNPVITRIGSRFIYWASYPMMWFSGRSKKNHVLHAWRGFSNSWLFRRMLRVGRYKAMTT